MTAFLGRTKNIIGGSCHKYHVCRDKHVCYDKTRLLSRQKYACYDQTFVATNIQQTIFVATKDMFCHDFVHLNIT